MKDNKKIKIHAKKIAKYCPKLFGTKSVYDFVFLQSKK